MVLHHVHAQFVAILQRRTIRAAIIINMKLGIPSMTTALTIRQESESEHAPPRHTHIPAATQALAQGLASARHFSAFILPFLVLVMRLTMRRRRNSDGAHLTEIISEVAEKEKKNRVGGSYVALCSRNEGEQGVHGYLRLKPGHGRAMLVTRVLWKLLLMACHTFKSWCSCVRLPLPLRIRQNHHFHCLPFRAREARSELRA